MQGDCLCIVLSVNLHLLNQMKKSLVALAVFGAFAASTAHADTAVSLSAGTTGMGIHLTAKFTDNVNFRFGLNGYNHDTTESTDDANYNLDVKLQTVDALVDYHPFGGGFRLTGGVMYNGNKLDARATPTGAGTYTFNGQTYTAADAGDVTGKIDFNKIAPYVGIGFGNAVAKNKGWGFTADLGVMFMGSAKINLASNNCTATSTVCDQLTNDLQAESAELRDDAKDFRYYPVARVGVAYRF